MHPTDKDDLGGPPACIPAAALENRYPFEDPSPGVAASSVADTRLGLVDQCQFTRECIARCLKTVHRDLQVLLFSGIEDCLAASPGKFDLVIFHMHGASVEDSDQTIASLKSAFGLFPVIILADLDDNDSVREVLKSGARGYIPAGSTSVAIAVEVIRLVRAGGTFVPLTTLQTAQHPVSSPGSLSPRQIAVLHEIRQGKSNKVIAHELGMSESTVKVHVRGIMKKLQATNRTEAVFRARAIYSGRPQLVTAPADGGRQVGGKR